MIGIREPKYKVGDRVLEIGNPKSGVWAVQQIIEYDFTIDLYRYLLIHADGINLFASEKNLKPYIEKPKTVWDLQNGDTYYVIDYDVMNVRSVMFLDDTDDINYRELGNCFLTKEEAECEIERRKVETEMLRLGGRRVFKKGENNYYIVCDFDSHYDIWISNNKYDGFGIGTIYFDSAKEGSNAIDSIGENRIKKYIFGVES